MEQIKEAMTTALQTQTAVAEKPLTDAAKPVKKATKEEKQSAAEYKAHREFVAKVAKGVIADVKALEALNRKVSHNWWTHLHVIACKCDPGNGQQFSREFDAVRQEILDVLKFKAAPKSETLSAKWQDLCREHSGYSTFNNYASQCKTWIVEVQASVDPKQSPDSFGRSVSNYYKDRKEAKAKGASGKATGTEVTTGTEQNAPGTVATGEQNLKVTAGLASVNMGKDTVTFPLEITKSLGLLAREIGHALQAQVPMELVNQVLIVARRIVGELDPQMKISDAADPMGDALVTVQAIRGELQEARKARLPEIAEDEKKNAAEG